ncbi:MAG: photosystem II protein Psb27 [Prochlorococcus sp.]|nr:photosystem II protein Psb27 [Prochlorococcus sp.]CAI8163148.1 MAG: Photosystem II lipoprotein Psb27 [Prochlorococcus marinus str. MIT 9215]
MTSALHRMVKQLMRAAVALCLGLCLMLTACGGNGSNLSGNYVEDTVAVAGSLQTFIAMPQDDENHGQAETDARALINNYISLYRPRPNVNGLQSFTTMQTALNSLAGHYNTYSNRPLPEALKERVDKELSKAERNVVRGS